MWSDALDMAGRDAMLLANTTFGGAPDCAGGEWHRRHKEAVVHACIQSNRLYGTDLAEGVENMQQPVDVHVQAEVRIDFALSCNRVN